MMQLREKSLKVEGIWTIKYYDKGDLVWEHTQKNLIVNSGLLILAKLMISDFDNAQIETIGFGDGTSSGSDAPSASDVVLGSDGIYYEVQDDGGEGAYIAPFAAFIAKWPVDEWKRLPGNHEEVVWNSVDEVIAIYGDIFVDSNNYTPVIRRVREEIH